MVFTEKTVSLNGDYREDGNSKWCLQRDSLQQLFLQRERLQQVVFSERKDTTNCVYIEISCCVIFR